METEKQEPYKMVIASIGYRFNRTVIGIGARLLNLRGYLFDRLQSLFVWCDPSSTFGSIIDSYEVRNLYYCKGTPILSFTW